MPYLALFTYHYVVDPENPLQKDIWGPTFKSFCEQVKYFKRKYPVANAGDFGSVLTSGPETDESIHIGFTFDDGLYEHYRLLSPFLLDQDIRGLFFIPTGTFEGLPPLPAILHYSLARYRIPKVVSWINQALEASRSEPRFIYDKASKPNEVISELKRFLRYKLGHELGSKALMSVFQRGLAQDIPDALEKLFITEGQMKEMCASGHVIGGHTHTHPSLGELDSPQLKKQEITNSIGKLQAKLGTPVEHFAYPFGSSDDLSNEAEELLKLTGIRYAYTTDPRLNTAHQDQWKIRRKSVYANDTVEKLEKYLEEQRAQIRAKEAILGS